jgi:hypothetical protein
MRLQQKLQQRREDRAKRAESATVSLPLEVAFVDESWMDEDSKKTNTKSRAKASKAKKSRSANRLQSGAPNSKVERAKVDDENKQESNTLTESMVQHEAKERGHMLTHKNVGLHESNEDKAIGKTDCGSNWDGGAEDAKSAATLQKVVGVMGMADTPVQSGDVFSREVLLWQRAANGATCPNPGKLPILQPWLPPPGLELIFSQAAIKEDPVCKDRDIFCLPSYDSSVQNDDASTFEGSECSTASLELSEDCHKEAILLACDMSKAVAQFLYGVDGEEDSTADFHSDDETSGSIPCCANDIGGA